MTAVADTVVTTKDEQRRDALAERLFGSLLAGNELLTVELGRRLGLYTAVHSHGRTTPAQLAARTGIAQRYAKEWLEQQAAAGILDVDGDHFTLPAAHVPVLLVDTDPAHLRAHRSITPADSGVSCCRQACPSRCSSSCRGTCVVAGGRPRRLSSPCR